MADRIHLRRDFAALRRPDRRGRSGPLRVSTVSLPDRSRAAVAYAIGREVGTAVTRNRVRRRLRAIVADLDLDPGLYLVRVDPAATACDAATLRSHLSRALGAVA